MLTELGKRIDKHSGNLNKELENMKKNLSELKNTITKMKNTLEGITKLRYIEAHFSELEDRIMEITQSEQQKEIF